MLLMGCGVQPTKVRPLCSPSGECFKVSKLSVATDVSAGQRVLEINVVPNSSLSEVDQSALADKVFAELAGEEAVTLGLSRAVVDLFPAIPAWGFSTSTGYRSSYIRQKDGSWKRGDGKIGTPLKQESLIKLDNGDDLVRTARNMRNGKLFLVYYCKTCAGPERIDRAAASLFEVARIITANDRFLRDVRRLHVSMFAGVRRNTWDFPQLLFLETAKDAGGHWKGLEQDGEASFIANVKADLARIQTHT